MTTNYVPNTNGKGRRAMSTEEINHWFRIWGILGKLRERPSHLKMVCVLDGRAQSVLDRQSK